MSTAWLFGTIYGQGVGNSLEAFEDATAKQEHALALAKRLMETIRPWGA